jgi:CDP-glucose 4,6-dehydratase
MSDVWKNKNVFITGSTGFIGCWLTKELVESGAKVTGLVRDVVPQSAFFQFNLHKKITIVNGKIDNLQLLKRIISEYEIDTVFHLAAQTQVEVAHQNPLATFETNIMGTCNILEACRTNGRYVKRIVVASTDKAYGEQAKLPYTENAPLQGIYPYDVSKSCTDLIAYSYFKTYQLPVCITRCGNVYGPGDLNYKRLIPGTILAVLKNQPIIIRSDGTFKRDYFYVKDTVNAYMTLANSIQKLNLSGEAFNFSSGIPMSVIDMTHKILDVMETKDYPIKILGEAKYEIKDQYLSNQKAYEKLGWKPKYTIEGALKETIDSLSSLPENN